MSEGWLLEERSDEQLSAANPLSQRTECLMGYEMTSNCPSRTV